MHILEAKNVHYVYEGGVQALKDVNFRADRGEVVALIGPNGAGKTTLLKHFNGLLFPSSGKVYVRGVEVRKENLRDIRREVGFLFQNPDDQIIAPTVEQDVAFGPLNFGMEEEMVAHNVKDSLELVGMRGYEDRPPHTLSYGQKKRVAIAGLLACNPSILVLDEPFSGLDPSGKRELMNILLRLRDDMSLTVVYTTHDVNSIPEFADRLYVMYGGEVVVNGTPEEVLMDRNLEDIGLETPIMFRIFRELVNRGIDVRNPFTLKSLLDTIEGLANEKK